jgi:hypothetical protein
MSSYPDMTKSMSCHSACTFIVISGHEHVLVLTYYLLQKGSCGNLTALLEPSRGKDKRLRIRGYRLGERG